MQSLGHHVGIPGEKGAYVLILRCSVSEKLTIGRLGVLDVEPGYYLYAGSALGPGGLKARLRHHARASGKPHWHIDYLRASTDLEEIWFAAGSVRREHQWAAALAGLRGATTPMPGFGSSDCNCETHLFHTRRKPSGASLWRRLRAIDPGHPRIIAAPGSHPELR